MYDYFYDEQSEQYQFLQLPWMLIKNPEFKTLSSDAKILYSLLLNRTSLSKKNGWRDEKNRIYLIYPIDEIREDLNCSKEKAVKSMQELTKIKLVESIRRGLGKPNIIYVKNFATSLKYSPISYEEPANPVNIQKSEKPTSRGRNNRLQGVGFSDSSNTYISNIYPSNIESSQSQSQIDSKKKEKADKALTATLDAQYISITENEKGPPSTAAAQSSVNESPPNTISTRYDYNTYWRIIQENIGYAHYVAHSQDIKLIDELVNCMLDVICTVGDTVKVAGEEKSRAMVISQYLKIDSMDIEHIIDKYREQRHKITHLHSYLKTMLYTVKQEAIFSVENQVRVDGVVWR